MIRYYSLYVTNPNNNQNLYGFFSLFVPLFTGVIVALFTSYVQKRQNEKLYFRRNEIEQRSCLYNAYEQLQGELIGFLTKLENLKKYISFVCPKHSGDCFSSLDIKTCSGQEVLIKLRDTINAISFERIKQASRDIVIGQYCDIIVSEALLVLKPECISDILTRFSKNAVRYAMSLQGDDYSEYESLINRSMVLINGDFCDASFWSLQDMAVINSVSCKERLDRLKTKWKAFRRDAKK